MVAVAVVSDDLGQMIQPYLLQLHGITHAALPFSLPVTLPCPLSFFSSCLAATKIGGIHLRAVEGSAPPRAISLYKYLYSIDILTEVWKTMVFLHRKPALKKTLLAGHELLDCHGRQRERDIE